MITEYFEVEITSNLAANAVVANHCLGVLVEKDDKDAIQKILNQKHEGLVVKHVEVDKTTGYAICRNENNKIKLFAMTYTPKSLPEGYFLCKKESEAFFVPKDRIIPAEYLDKPKGLDK